MSHLYRSESGGGWVIDLIVAEEKEDFLWNLRDNITIQL